MKRVWLVEVTNDKGDEVWRQTAPFAQYSMAQMKDLLRLLTAKAELGFDEIFQSTGKRGDELGSLLDVHKSLRVYALRSGSHWSVSARLMLQDKDGTLQAPRPAHL